MAKKVITLYQAAAKIARTLSPRERAQVREHLVSVEPNVRAITSDLLKLRVTPALKGKSRPKVFISHNHRDKPFVRDLKARLELDGMEVWLDEERLNIGESLVISISDALKAADFVVAVISSNSVASRWVQEEVQQALSHQLESGRVKVLPVVKNRCAVPAYLAGRLVADFSTPKKYEEVLLHLVESIRRLHVAKIA